jgi:hypothetical protein
MNEVLGPCGLICSECPAYIAYLNDDDDLRKKTAVEWSRLYSSDILPEDINCTGCLQEGIKNKHCDECNIRLCSLRKKVATCADCILYSCEVLDEFLKYVPQARQKLETLKAEDY